MSQHQRKCTKTAFTVRYLIEMVCCKAGMLCTEEGQFLEGEERIAFLMSKIQDLRRVYMDLKAEVACIDRRRRRHRIKEREGMQHITSSLSRSLFMIPSLLKS